MDKKREGLLPIGTLLGNGKYRIESHISSGGFGNTYVATDTAFDEKVAIKELFIKGVCGRMDDSVGISISLNENKNTFAAQQEKFRKEARRIRKLTNRHIVKVHDLFDDNGTSYYVMDYIEGESLGDRLKREKTPLSESEVMSLLPQVLDALETVHNEKIWHLDLKPANIMVDKNGNAQLIDFGASKQLKNSDGSSMATSTAMAYTPGYAPAEQLEQNYEKFGPWTDLYSLGATLYYSLTCVAPPSPTDIAEDAKAALALPENTSAKMQELILWLMKPYRNMRPQSVADVKQFLAETPKPAAEDPKPAVEEPKPEPEPRSTSEDGDETVLAGGKKPVSKPVPNSIPKPASAPKPTPAPQQPEVNSYMPEPGFFDTYGMLIVKVAIGTAVAIIAVIILVVCLLGGNDTEVTDDGYSPYQVTDSAVVIDYGPENMHKFTYTGFVNDSTGMPEGQGTAKFKKTRNVSAATYTGKWLNGLCNDDGEAELIFENGDSYKGSFKDGEYVEGTYKLSDGTYFVGTFRNGSPFNGTWYTADGQRDGDLKDGVEQ